MARKITWFQAAEILGSTDRHVRRIRERYEFGYDGVFDRRRGKPSPKRVPLATVEAVLGLYRERYFDLNVRHFHGKLKTESFKMKCTAAPFLGSNIGDSLGEVPAVVVKVLSVVLALAIGLVLGFRQDYGTVLSRAFAVRLGIFDANLQNVRVVGYHVAFGDGEAAIPSFHLDAVIGNAKTDGKAKSLCQPIGRCAGVGVDEYRNHDAWRNGSVGSHWETLSLTASGRAAD